MGSQQSSEMMRSSPTVERLINAINLNKQKDQITNSLCHRLFTVEFIRVSKSKFDRSMNPFCPVRVLDQQECLTCCIVSPIMAIVNANTIASNNGQYNKQCQILPVFKRSETKIKVDNLIIIKNNSLALLVLQKPYWKVGWAGISYIKDSEELKKLQLKIVSHPQKKVNKQTQVIIYIQEVSRLAVPKMSELTNQYQMKCQGKQGSLICKLINSKPYIIGIQISKSEIQFFDINLFTTIQEKVKLYIKKNGGEKEILKAMDITQFQIETQL